jgi:endonuclease G
MPAAPAASGEVDFIDETESVVSDYRDRGGFDPAFLGNKFAVDLPTISRDAEDILDFEVDGETETELKYEHFSVVMSRNRRMCFLSVTSTAICRGRAQGSRGNGILAFPKRSRS